jgi:hypothetical protein
MLALTAAETRALTWLSMKTYAVCRRLNPSMAHTIPNKGARCADTSGISSELLARRSPAYCFSIDDSSLAAIVPLNDLSQILSSALP